MGIKNRRKSFIYNKMKIIKKKSILKTSILLTNLINNRIYLGLLKSNWRPKNKKFLIGFKNNFCIFDLNQTLINMRNSFKLINIFHKLKKNILFVGFPRLEKKKICSMLKINQHYYLPHNSWVNGLLGSNQIILNKFNPKRVNSQKDLLLDKFGGILKLSKTPDLIVIYNNSFEPEALKESLNLNIPVISFVNTQDPAEKIEYKIPGGFYANESGRMYYNLLMSSFTNSYYVNRSFLKPPKKNENKNTQKHVNKNKR